MTLKFCPLPPSIEAVQPSPAMAPYSLPKEDVKWPPTLQPPVVLAPPAPGPNLLVPAHGNAADFGEVFSEVLPSSHPQPGPLSTSLPPAAEQLLPDLLISPHMLPRKNPRERGGGWAGRSSWEGGG